MSNANRTPETAPGAPPGPTAQQVGAALGVAVVGAVFFHSFRTGSASGDTARAAGHAFALTSLTSFAIAALAAVLVFLLPKVATTRA